MPNATMLYTIEELADLTGIIPRTIRFYQTQGLLPTPETRGRHALYNEAHLNRLRLIDQMKAAYLPLAVIKEKLAQINDTNAIALAGGETPLEEGGGEVESADAYIARVLANRRALSANRPPKAVTPSGRRRRAPEESAEALDAPGESWRHVTVSTGIQLRFKVPVASKNREALESLLAYAQSLK